MLRCYCLRICRAFHIYSFTLAHSLIDECALPRHLTSCSFSFAAHSLRLGIAPQLEKRATTGFFTGTMLMLQRTFTLFAHRFLSPSVCTQRVLSL